MRSSSKLFLYFRAAAALGSPNLIGFPVIPKGLWQAIPYSRAAYNSFVIWIKALAVPNVATVFDVGANHGDFAHAATNVFPSASVYLFEPLPHLQQELSGKIAHQHKPWHLSPFALGSERGSFPLYIDQTDDAIGSLSGFTEEYLRANPAARPTKKIDCEVRTLDDVVSETQIPLIDILKIDVEGFEFEVLKGAAATLQRTRAIFIEVSLIRHAPGVTSPLVEMLDILSRNHFNIVDIIPSLFDAAAPWKPVEFNVLARKDDSEAGQSNR